MNIFERIEIWECGAWGWWQGVSVVVTLNLPGSLNSEGSNISEYLQQSIEMEELRRPQTSCCPTSSGPRERAATSIDVCRCLTPTPAEVATTCLLCMSVFSINLGFLMAPEDRLRTVAHQPFSSCFFCLHQSHAVSPYLSTSHLWPTQKAEEPGVVYAKPKRTSSGVR